MDELKTTISEDRIIEIFNNIDKISVCLIGDICLDVYWEADMTLSELSRETPHFPLPIVSERYCAGGAGNVACNIAALKPKITYAIGLIGDDWRGQMLKKNLCENNIDVSNIVTSEQYVTPTYIKPIRTGISNIKYEDPRLDFENRKPICTDDENKIIDNLKKIESEVDVICVCDQLKFGCITDKVREYLCNLGKKGKRIIVDSRDSINKYKYVSIKPNEVELSRAFGTGDEFELSDMEKLARKAFEKTERTSFVTLGDRGSLVVNKNSVTHIFSCKVEPPIDFCGAGDTFNASLCVMLSAGATETESSQIATLSSAVTIKKLNQTGTATREEILEQFNLQK